MRDYYCMKSSDLLKLQCIALSLLALQACEPEEPKTTQLGDIESIPYYAEQNAKDSPYRCDDLVKSSGAQAAFSVCLSSAQEGNMYAQARLGAMYATDALGAEDWENANHWLLKAAEQGHIEAQYIVAKSLQLGRGIKKNEAVAFEFLTRAAKANFVSAQAALGECYLTGKGTEKNMAQAQKWLMQSAQLENPESQYQIGKMYLDGDGVAKNPHLGLRYLTLAAQQQHMLAQVEVANLYHQGQLVERNDEAALKWYQAAASQEEPNSLYVIGMGYIQGSLSLQKNFETGAQYLKRSADKGFYPAQYALATLYLEGHPVLKDKFAAIEYLRQAAVGGSHDAQVKLAKVLMEFSIPQYDKVAFYWASQAAVGQNQDALYLLGNFYVDGIGTEVDYIRASEIFNKLAEQDHPLAELKLGQMYYYGQGVEQDRLLAKKWFLKSARHGLSDAKNWVAIVFRDGINSPENDENHEIQDEINEWIKYAAANGEPEAIYLKGINHLYGRNSFQQNVEYGLELVEDAASKQFVPAQRELGMVYEQGLFGLNNSSKAYQWYLKASENGDGYAQYRLANMYYLGDVIQRNYIESYVWANLASMSGKEEAIALRDEVSNLLASGELKKARELSDKLFNEHKRETQTYAMPTNVGIP